LPSNLIALTQLKNEERRMKKRKKTWRCGADDALEYTMWRIVIWFRMWSVIKSKQNKTKQTKKGYGQ